MVALNVPLPETSCETFVVSKETLSDVIKPCNLVCGRDHSRTFLLVST